MHSSLVCAFQDLQEAKSNSLLETSLRGKKKLTSPWKGILKANRKFKGYWWEWKMNIWNAQNFCKIIIEIYHSPLLSTKLQGKFKGYWWKWKMNIWNAQNFCKIIIEIYHSPLLSTKLQEKLSRWGILMTMKNEFMKCTKLQWDNNRNTSLPLLHKITRQA